MDEAKNEVVEDVTVSVVEEPVAENFDGVVDNENVENVAEASEQPTEENFNETPEQTEQVEETVEEVTTETTEEVVEESNDETDYSALYSELKEKYDLLKKEFSDYKAEHSFLNSEYETLNEYKANNEAKERKIAEEQLFAKYASKIGETKEFKELVNNSSNYSLDELKKECLCVVGMYSMTEEVTKNEKSDSLKFSFENSKEDEIEDPYNGLIKHYLKR